MGEIIPNRHLQAFTGQAVEQLRNTKISGLEAAKQGGKLFVASLGNFGAHTVTAAGLLLGACTLKAAELCCAFFGKQYDLNTGSSREFTLAQTATQMHKAAGSLLILAMSLTTAFKPQWIVKVCDRFGFAKPHESLLVKGQRLLGQGVQCVRNHPRTAAAVVAGLVAFDLYQTGYLAGGASLMWSKMPYVSWEKPVACPAPTECPLPKECPPFEKVVCPPPEECVSYFDSTPCPKEEATACEPSQLSVASSEPSEALAKCQANLTKRVRELAQALGMSEAEVLAS